MNTKRMMKLAGLLADGLVRNAGRKVAITNSGLDALDGGRR